MSDPKQSLLEDRKLYLLMTRGYCTLEPLECLRRALDGGVDLVQVREKPFGPNAISWVIAVQKICKSYAVPVIVNDDLDLRAAAMVDGAHLGQEDLRVHQASSLSQREYVLGISTHDPAELERALLEAPDYIGIGPCYATKTKGYERGNDPELLRQLIEASPVPAFAIGGITTERIPALLELGFDRIAVSSAILDSGTPERVATDMMKELA